MCYNDKKKKLLFYFILFESRVGKLNSSPWAVKKINSKCASKQVEVYQMRLNEEAELLKGINHPNIVGKTKNKYIQANVM